MNRTVNILNYLMQLDVFVQIISWRGQTFLQCRHILQGKWKQVARCKYNSFAFSLVVAQLNEYHFLASTNMTEIPSSSAGWLYMMLPHAVLHVNGARAQLSPSLLLWLRLHLPSPSRVSSNPILFSNIPHFLQKAPSFLSAPSQSRMKRELQHNDVNKTELMDVNNHWFWVITEKLLHNHHCS